MYNKEFKKFGRERPSLELPYLLSVQKESWDNFWKEGLGDLFSEVFPIYDHTEEKFKLEFLGYKLGKPKYKDYVEAKKNNDSFEAPLRIKVKLTNLNTKESKKQEVFITDFPLMTKKGIFLVNGVERVIISQLIRSPGVFFSKETKKGKDYFGAKIIPKRGAWLEFETERSGRIGVRINRRRKVAATSLLRAFGITTDKEIKAKFKKVDKGDRKSVV